MCKHIILPMFYGIYFFIMGAIISYVVDAIPPSIKY